MLFFNANFICYYFYPTKKREEPKNIQDMLKDNNEYTVKAALNRLTSLNLIEKVGGNRNRTYRRVMSTLEMMKKIDVIFHLRFVNMNLTGLSF